MPANSDSVDTWIYHSDVTDPYTGCRNVMCTGFEGSLFFCDDLETAHHMLFGFLLGVNSGFCDIREASVLNVRIGDCLHVYVLFGR